MKNFSKSWVRCLAAPLLLILAIDLSADVDALSGTWIINENDSDSLKTQMNALKQEYRDWKDDQDKDDDDPEKPSPFDRNDLRKQGYETRRGGSVAKPSVAVNRIVTAEQIRLYISERIIVAYDGKLKRLISPNPLGRVHSAKGRGISKDATGETLAYLENDTVVIETRTKITERLTERFEMSSTGQLKVMTRLYNPDWRREIEFVRMYDRDKNTLKK